MEPATMICVTGAGGTVVASLSNSLRLHVSRSGRLDGPMNQGEGVRLLVGAHEANPNGEAAPMLPDGLSWAELTAVLRTAVESGRAVGIELTIYNPKLDSDGASGRGLTATLVEALGG